MKGLQIEQANLLEREKNTQVMETSETPSERFYEMIAKWESEHKSSAMNDRTGEFATGAFYGNMDIFSMSIGKTKKTISLEMEEQIRGRDEA